MHTAPVLQLPLIIYNSNKLSLLAVFVTLFVQGFMKGSFSTRFIGNKFRSRSTSTTYGGNARRLCSEVNLKTSLWCSSMSTLWKRSLHGSGTTSLSMVSGRPPYPLEPLDYSSKFICDDFPITVLEEKNPHPLDARIRFEKEAHRYFLDGVPVDASVTEVVESFFEKFNPDVVIPKMMNGINWPREGYMTKDGRPFTEQEIRKKWDEIGMYARNKGTYMHRNFECLMNGLDPNPNLEELGMFRQFYNEVINENQIVPFRTEWRIAAPEYDIAGSVDFVGKLPTGSYVIIDWKRSKDLANKMKSDYGKRAMYPVEHLDDCDGAKYSLQLNMYRFILQKYYGLHISNMGIASFHPQCSSYFYTEVGVYEKEVEAIFNEVVKRRAQSRGQPPHARMSPSSTPQSVAGSVGAPTKPTQPTQKQIYAAQQAAAAVPKSPTVSAHQQQQLRLQQLGSPPRPPPPPVGRIPF